MVVESKNKVRSERDDERTKRPGPGPDQTKQRIPEQSILMVKQETIEAVKTEVLSPEEAAAAALLAKVRKDLLRFVFYFVS